MAPGRAFWSALYTMAVAARRSHDHGRSVPRSHSSTSATNASKSSRRSSPATTFARRASMCSSRYRCWTLRVAAPERGRSGRLVGRSRPGAPSGSRRRAAARAGRRRTRRCRRRCQAESRCEPRSRRGRHAARRRTGRGLPRLAMRSPTTSAAIITGRAAADSSNRQQPAPPPMPGRGVLYCADQCPHRARRRSSCRAA